MHTKGVSMPTKRKVEKNKAEGTKATAIHVKEAYIRFMAPVTPQTTQTLLNILDGRIKAGYDKLHLMISSPGGSIFHGLSVHNFIKVPQLRSIRTILAVWTQ